MSPANRDDPFGWVGHVLGGKYRIEAVVGEGGFGVVYKAHHSGFEETVAVKCLKLKPKLSEAAHDEFLKRFLAEGKLLHQLSRATADVVQALDVGVARSPNGTETPYLVLEWLEGTTLDRELRARAAKGERAMPLEEALALLEPAARGLAIAHDQGISHRDVKPANLVVCEVGGRTTLKVVDFGIAKAPDDADTATGPFDDLAAELAAFTPRYGAPEQFTRQYGATGPWTDVFALALVFVELVLGESALQGDDPVQLYIAASDLSRRPTLRQRGVDTSDEVEQVLLRALAVDPRNRYRSAGEFWDALVHAVETARPAKPRSRSVRPPSSVIPTPQPERADPSVQRADAGGPEPSRTAPGTITVMLREQRRRKVVWIGTIAVTVGIVAGALVGIWRTDMELSRGADAGAATLASASGSAGALASQSASAVAPPPPPPTPAPDSIAGMIAVPAARFTMGSNLEGKNERPAHPVRLTRAFYIDRTEVTTEAYAKCIAAGACTPNLVRKSASDPGMKSPLCNDTGDANFARQPINCVTYEQATAYCRWAGKRLPTEAEWELAARGTDGRAYPWGDTPPTTCRMAIVGGLDGPCGKRKGTYEVGTTLDGLSPYGAMDMSGNVWEWVADAFETYGKVEATDPFVPPRGNARGVIRGGSWDYSAIVAKTSVRLPMDRGWAQPSIGFRCAR
jgi:formylglycine-generating enzyme required for sulfatase activity/serine/threonine protein kinase